MRQISQCRKRQPLKSEKPSEGNVNNAVFGEMTFTQAGTYVYEITENAGNAEGMTYDGHTTTVTVAVFENQTEGILWAQVLYDNSTALTESDKYVSDAAAFTNTQAVEAVFELNGTKVLEGRDFQEGDSFTFNVKAEDGAPMRMRLMKMEILPFSLQMAAAQISALARLRSLRQASISTILRSSLEMLMA